jgi:hypothetical protein
MGVDVEVFVVWRNEHRVATVPPGSTVAAVVAALGYPRSGQEALRVWRNGSEISFDDEVIEGMKIGLTHQAMRDFCPS